MKDDHKLFPNRLMMTTASFPVAMFDLWQQVNKSPWIFGDFVLGTYELFRRISVGYISLENRECNYAAGIFGRGWPYFVSGIGGIDLTGFEKPQSYYLDIVWGRS